MIKRVIFDIDCTLIKPNYENEGSFFQKYVSKNNDYFIHHMYEILTEYEQNNFRYEIDSLLEHLNKYSGGVLLDEKFYDDWLAFIMDIEEQDVSIVHDVLSYLTTKYELVALSNGFRVTQTENLRKLDLLKYFVEIYGGEDCIKPRIESYYMAIGSHRPDECVMIGDSLSSDVIGAINAGLHAIHYTNGKDVEHNYPKVKCLSELKDLL